MPSRLKKYQDTLTTITTKYARYVTPSSLFFGFIMDNLILKRIDSLFTFSIISYHFILITLGILLLHATHKSAQERGKHTQMMRSALSIIIPFSFGALFSGFFIFYSQSAGSLLSWFFLMVLMLFMISTEYYKKHYLNTLVQVTLWYFTLLSFLILYVPIALKQMNAGVFLLSGMLSIFIAMGFLGLLSRAEPWRYNEYATKIVRNIVLVLTTVSVLYFTNIIPPIPLALKHMGAYYSVLHTGNTYTLLTEKHKWYDYKRYIPATIYHTSTSPVSVFSSVFAPERLSPNLSHQWQYKSVDGYWVTASTIPTPIIGGRENGYRGYTTKENIFAGSWRVRIITEQEQVVGTVRFTIVDVPNLPSNLVEVAR